MTPSEKKAIRKAFAEFRKNNPKSSKAILMVRKLIDDDEVLDIANNGILGGYDGFIYHYDCARFYKKYRTEINEYLKDLADMFGTSLLEGIKGMYSLAGFREDEIYQVIFGKLKFVKNDDDDTVIAADIWRFFGESVIAGVYSCI